jgi:hypothetical protein
MGEGPAREARSSWLTERAVEDGMRRERAASEGMRRRGRWERREATGDGGCGRRELGLG